jgi:hypothetical protein
MMRRKTGKEPTMVEKDNRNTSKYYQSELTDAVGPTIVFVYSVELQLKVELQLEKT